MKKHQDYSVRRLPGPAIRPLCEGVQTPEAHHELFRDWQRTQTQSSATAPWEPEAANRCLVLLESRDHRPRGHGCETAHPDLINARSPERANRHLCFSLDLDLHRSGQSRHYSQKVPPPTRFASTPQRVHVRYTLLPDLRSIAFRNSKRGSANHIYTGSPYARI